MIRVENLTKAFDSFLAVSGISFEVREGEVYALLGPNGSGKTTTMKSIVGLTIPTGGLVSVGGLDVARFPREARRLLSYLPQKVAFPESQTAAEVLRFHSRLRRVSSSRVGEVLDQQGLSRFSSRPVGEFSGGMLQRLGLAVASIADAPILILDEPTANLDPHGVKSFRQFILQQKERGKTIMFSTHLLAEAEQLADKVGIFVGGKLVSEVSIPALRSAFQSSITIEDMYLSYVDANKAG